MSAYTVTEKNCSLRDKFLGKSFGRGGTELTVSHKYTSLFHKRFQVMQTKLKPHNVKATGNSQVGNLWMLYS